mgnify:CR=1 FL=1
MKIVDGIIAVIYVIAMAVLFFLRDCENCLLYTSDAADE